MQNIVRRACHKNSQSGMTMLEVLIAGVVLVIGFMAMMGLVMTAVASNNRNRMDSTSVMLVQALLENVDATLVGTGTSSIVDGNGTTWNINTAVGGAAVAGGQIDFSQNNPPVGYFMNFVVCNGSFQANTACQGVQTVYDVRWRVQTVTAGTYMVTIGAEMKNQGNQTRYFALPISLRTYVGQ